MRKRLFSGVTVLFYLLLSVSTFILNPSVAYAQGACPAVDSVKVSMQLPISGSYAIWLHAATNQQQPTSLSIRFDGEANCESLKLPSTDTFQWTSGTNGTLTRMLTVGAHEAELFVVGGNFKADRLLVTGNTGCTPTGDGTNCVDQSVDIQVVGLQANQTVKNTLNLATTLVGATLVNAKVQYVFDTASTPYAVRTSSPYCLFKSGEVCASGDISSLGSGAHSVQIIVSADNMNTYTKRIPFIVESAPAAAPVTSTPTPPVATTPVVITKPAATVSPAKNNTIVVGTTTNAQSKTALSKQVVTVSPTQALKTGESVTYSVNNKTVGSSAITEQNPDPSTTLDLSDEPDGETTVSATINRLDGSSETYGAKTKVDNSRTTATQNWFKTTGIRLIFSTIALILLVVGGILIYRVIKRRRDYALFHNVSDYEYVQPQGDSGAYALPPLALVFLGIGALFSSLGGAESARVGVLADLTQANLPTGTYVASDASQPYVFMLGGTIATAPTTPTNPTTPQTPTAPPATPPVTGNALEHLNKILSATSRNRSNDDASYAAKPSAGLENDSKLLSADNIASYTYESKKSAAEVLALNSSYGNFGEFRAECDFSHFSYDDPIKYPNQPGKGHLHMFFGNSQATVFSDYNSILNSGNSTCAGHEINRTVYWSAAAIDQDGNPRKPMKILVYYKSYMINDTNTEWWAPANNGVDKVKPVVFPENLQMLSNFTGCSDTTLTSEQVMYEKLCPTDKTITYYAKNRELGQYGAWTCGVVWSNGAHNGNDYNTFEDRTQMPSCPATASLNDNPVRTLQEHILFPYCTTGQDLKGKSYADIKQNTSWQINSGWYFPVCPTTHPYKIPMIEYKISYPLYPGDDTSKWKLSSDIDPQTGKMLTTPYGYWENNKRVSKTATNGATSHGGWMGGWNRTVLDKWVKSCNWVVGANCQTGVFPVPYSSETKALLKPTRTPLNPTSEAPDNIADRGWFTLKYNNVFKTDGQLLHAEICGQPKLFTVGGDIPTGADISHCIKP